jgi:Beta xylosidase C-terminal Concanavalin A-like domain
MYRNRSYVLRAMVSLLAFTLAAGSACAITTQLPADGAANRSADPGAPLASSFPGPLWEVVTPQGGTATVTNGHLYLNVPGGSNHDALRPSNQSVRVVQPIGNEDFDISIKIDSKVVASDAGTSQGLMVLADDKDFLTFALATDGTHISLAVHRVSGGVAATVFNEADFNEYQNPIYLRLNRTGTNYVAYYSVDGVVWTQATNFTDTRVQAFLGPFAGNYNGTPGKAVPVVMAINWFDIL